MSDPIDRRTFAATCRRERCSRPRGALGRYARRRTHAARCPDRSAVHPRLSEARVQSELEEPAGQPHAHSGLRHIRAHGSADGEEDRGQGTGCSQRDDGLGSGRLGKRSWRCFAHGPPRHRRVPPGEGRPDRHLLRRDDGSTRRGQSIPHSSAEVNRLPRATRFHSPFPRPARKRRRENTRLPPDSQEDRAKTKPVSQEARG